MSDVKATRTAHRSKDSRQRSHGSDSQAGSRCSYQLRTQHNDKQSTDPVISRGTADEVTGSDPVISSDMTVESSQLHYALVTLFVVQALEIMRSSPEVVAAEEWRKLV